MDNTPTAQKIIDIWNNHNVPDNSVLQKMIDPKYVCHDPNVPKDFGKGPDGFKQRLAFFAKAFPDFKITVDENFGGESTPCKDCGSTDRVTLRWKVMGTHKGELFGYDPTNKVTHSEGSSIMHFSKDGKLLEEYVSWDSANLVDQITPAEEKQRAAAS